MRKFEIVTGKPKRSYKPTLEQYKRAVDRLFKRMREEEYDSKETAKKFLFLQVKILSSREERKALDYDYIRERMSLYFTVTDCLAFLTPREFMQIFPVEKTYDWKKWQIKDYISTMEEISKYDPDQPIGADKIEALLMEYQNPDIANFEVEKMMCMSALRQFRGQKGIMEEFMEEQGIPAYTRYENEGIMVNNLTGEVIKIKEKRKRKPCYLKAIGGENCASNIK